MFSTALNKTLLLRANKKFLPRIKNKKAASYLTITLSLMAFSFFGLFALRPTLITAVSLIKSVSDLKALNTEYENKIAGIIKAQSEYEQMREELPLLSIALPDNAYFDQVASVFEKLATTSNVTIAQIQMDSTSVSKAKSRGMLEKFGFIVIGTGDYPSISSYINHILNWRRIITLSTLEFVHDGSTTSGNLRVTLRGNAYYEP